MLVESAGTDHGYTRFSAPCEATSHSATVGKCPPSHAQKAKASNQVMQFAGRVSLVPGASVHVPQSLPHAFCSAMSAARSAGNEVSQLESQPLFAILGSAPAPALGLLPG